MVGRWRNQLALVSRLELEIHAGLRVERLEDVVEIDRLIWNASGLFDAL